MSVMDSYDELRQHLAEAKERFTSEREGAVMTVVKDDGAYRHLLFHFPRASWGLCEVVTWPEMLVLRGGLGYWSFAGVKDMLDFFREPEDIARIDPVCVEGKLIPGSRDSAAKTFDPGRAAAYIRQTVADHTHEHPGLAADVDSQIFSDHSGADLTTEQGLREALARFSGSTEDIYEGFRFSIEEWELDRYSPWFLLSCVLLPWAVEQYDAQLATVG